MDDLRKTSVVVVAVECGKCGMRVVSGIAKGVLNGMVDYIHLLERSCFAAFRIFW